jgi:hypothetical protein
MRYPGYSRRNGGEVDRYQVCSETSGMCGGKKFCAAALELQGEVVHEAHRPH